MAMTMIAPWIDFYREVEALFKNDPSVRVLYNDEQKELRLYVDDSNKAYALTEVMPIDKVFGNVKLDISIIPANSLPKSARIKAEDYFTHIFKNNPILIDIQTVYGVFSNPITYVVFRKEVVQYFNDDLGDINGLRSTLWQDIANDVFTEAHGVYFCTDTSNYQVTYDGNSMTFTTSSVPFI